MLILIAAGQTTYHESNVHLSRVVCLNAAQVRCKQIPRNNANSRVSNEQALPFCSWTGMLAAGCTRRAHGVQYANCAGTASHLVHVAEHKRCNHSRNNKPSMGYALLLSLESVEFALQPISGTGLGKHRFPHSSAAAQRRHVLRCDAGGGILWGRGTADNSAGPPAMDMAQQATVLAGAREACVRHRRRHTEQSNGMMIF